MPPLSQELQNQTALLDKAAQALAANAAFLANASPTQNQVLVQVRALTRQTDAIIRLLIGSLSDVTDT